MPLGLPVVPLVYSVNSGCSASSAIASCLSEAPFIWSCHQTSRPSCHAILFLQRCTTTTRSTSVPLIASSTLSLSGTIWPRRQPPSEVMAILAPASRMRSASASAANPPNTTEWVAPMRAQASIAITVSGRSGM